MLDQIYRSYLYSHFQMNNAHTTSDAIKKSLQLRQGYQLLIRAIQTKINENIYLPCDWAKAQTHERHMCMHVV